MTDSRHHPDSTDDLLTQHFRQHASGEPPASMDAFILATARREAPAPKPSLWQRWLQACQRPRWQMAFATVAGVALMIGLVVRSPVPTVGVPAPEAAQYAAAPPPPALAAPAAPAPMARLAMAPQADNLQIQAEVSGAMADAPAARMSKRATAALLPTLEQELQEILRLRQVGEDKAADEKLLALHTRFPGEDLPARLEALQKR